MDSGAYTSHNTGVPIKRDYRKAAKGEKRRSWPEIFYQTKEIVGSLPNAKRRNVHVVAPDEVGKFENTLDLYRDKELIKQFKEVQELGAEIIFPVQKSEGSTLLTNYRKMFRVLDKEGLALARTRRIHYGGSKKGWKETVKSDFSERTTLGIPYKKKTWKQAEIVQFFKDLEKAAGWIKNAEFRYNLDSGQKRLLRDLDKFKDSTRYLPTFNRIGAESEFIPDIHLLGGGPEKVAALKKALDKEGVPYGSIVGDATSRDVNEARFGTGEKKAKKKVKKKAKKKVKKKPTKKPTKKPLQPGDVVHGKRHPASTWKGSVTLPEPGRRVGSPAPGPKEKSVFPSQRSKETYERLKTVSPQLAEAHLRALKRMAAPEKKPVVVKVKEKKKPVVVKAKEKKPVLSESFLGEGPEPAAPLKEFKPSGRAHGYPSDQFNWKPAPYKGKSSDQIWAEEILRKDLNNIRFRHHSYAWSEPSRKKAVKELKNIEGEYSAKRAVELGADFGPIRKGIKRLVKILKDGPSGSRMSRGQYDVEVSNLWDEAFDHLMPQEWIDLGLAKRFKRFKREK